MSDKKKLAVEPNGTADEGLSRRDFFKTGAGAGVIAITGAGAAEASQSKDAAWDYEADVIVLGSGCTGLPAAIRANDLGASVLVIEQNSEAGGRAQHSGSWVSLGGGDVVQERDKAGDVDAEGFITVDPLVPAEALEDDVELLFKDATPSSFAGTC